MLRRILLASAGAVALSGAALATDLLTRAPPPAFVPPPPLWTGFYIGLNAGYTFGGSNSATFTTLALRNPALVGTAATSAAAFASAAALSTSGVVPINNSGFIGGGQIGYNWQFGNSWLVGLEADIQGTGARGSGNRFAIAPVGPPIAAGTTFASNIAASNFVDYLGTVRGRLGFLWTPTFLVFGDGGFAYGGVHQNVHIDSILTSPVGVGNTVIIPAFGSFTNTRVGWTAGGGFEWMFMPNWSAKLEYLYYDIGRATFVTSPSILRLGNAPAVIQFANLPTVSTRFNGHIVRVGLNYHFWTAPPPVIAKY
jgi:outer membrane immunogenic protein